jgi:glycosyltransferase involved in cell wall biosynthesis
VPIDARREDAVSLRIAIVASHPVQYQAPWFRALAARATVTVFFCHRQDRAGQAAAGYGEGFEWDVPLFEGYSHTWLANVARDKNVFHFNGCDTPEIGVRIGDGHFDACIISGWYLKSYIQALFACRRHDVPVLLRGDSQLATARSAVKKLVKYVPYRMMLNSVAGHLYVGEANRRYLAHYGVPADRLFFVPHVVDDRWFAERAARARDSGAVSVVRRALDIPEDAVMVLFVGRFVEQKRPFDFVDAIARAGGKRHVVGVMVGSGPMADAIEARRRDTGAILRMPGFRNQSALSELYAASNVLVLPSDAGETWGLVVNEAMACGTPAIVSDAVGCAADMIRPHTGRVYPVGDVDALANAILEVDELRRTSSNAVARELLELTARYSADAAADATIRAVAHVSASSEAQLA